jgi:hypothetical protein
MEEAKAHWGLLRHEGKVEQMCLLLGRLKESKFIRLAAVGFFSWNLPRCQEGESDKFPWQILI